MPYWLFKWFLFAPVIKAVCRPWIEGRKNVPPTGPAILVSNHLSYGDTVLLPALIERRVTFPAKSELFTGQRSLGGRVVGWFLRNVGMLPMDRSGGRASNESVDAVGQVLQAGEIVGIYPEGTRSPDGRLYKGKTGVARLVLGHRVRVLPVATVGTEFVKGWFGIPFMRRPGIRIGPPLDFSAYYDRATDRAVLRYVTDEIMAAVQSLSGQRYVDVYATSVKSGALAGRNIEEKVRPRPGTGVPPAPLETEPLRRTDEGAR
ncbi:1-acyl-sn-glycerol-3-phosphate acyltransferase [Naumannella sp. ID2617S]|uniref:1-acyl-sn-glycerol-3-phosphate acyltransferase n=1 Tax=Enemella dayhoffiae TaxID=2016507 RepID=A0A255HAK1_9ACTN|nr:lysophospholipid acyltransferase family protein [Enemella dayhoffiae]NNG18534.1 1-acyl-sn-glycerol-3-phosphate acyltransferase [Naumannella sp. ID2617S]OYO24625.1 1-acyl-sn-glycerol-3-phosphate acyltransferase [Enemella dayhoffiae]